MSEDVKSYEDLIASLPELAEAVTMATTKLLAAEKEEMYARSRASDAANQLNHAQKKLTAVLDELKKRAPRQSDWGRSNENRRT